MFQKARKKMFIPKGIRFYKKWKLLSKNERALYLFLAVEFIDHPVMIGYNDIERDFGLSVKTAIATIRGLEEKGFIKKSHTFRDNKYEVIKFWVKNQDGTYSECPDEVDKAAGKFKQKTLIKEVLV